MLSLEADSCPGNEAGKQRLMVMVVAPGECYCSVLAWPASPAVQECALCTFWKREAWGGLGSCPTGLFEEARRAQPKEARSIPHGLRREFPEATLNKAHPESRKLQKGTVGMPPCRACEAQNCPAKQELSHPLTSLQLGPWPPSAVRGRQQSRQSFCLPAAGHLT